VTVYAELLRQAAADRHDAAQAAPTASLAAAVLAAHARLGTSPRAVDRLSDQLAYDLALVEACHRLGIAEGLSSGEVTEQERARVRAELARAWPGLDVGTSAVEGSPA